MNYEHSNTNCRDIQIQLSDYIENSLSARQVWDVEKHLADCADCAEQLRQLKATVELLRGAPRYDTSQDFMAALHARLDGLEPTPTPTRTLLDGLRDWLAGARSTLQQNRLPALSLGLAAVVLILMFAVNRPDVSIPPPTPQSIPHSVAMVPETTLPSVAAESTGNPFADPAADTLEDRSVWRETGGSSDTSRSPANL